jgi:transglutaminase-like putative cysteine protease
MSSPEQPDSPDLIEREGAQPDFGAVRYRVRHSTAYRYGDEILLAHHLLHLTPRPVANQRVVSFRMDVAPAPSVRTDHVDYFGNPATYLEMREPHGRLTVTTEMEVDVEEPFAASAAILSWEAVRDRLDCPSGEHARDADGYRHASSLVPIGDDLKAYALPSFPAGRAIGEAALDLTRRIHAEFTFDPEATTVSTPVAEVLRDRRGVCQDFAHLEIGCLRSLGLSARYVSGYLRTIPPPGRPRLIGADVSHAWVSIWCGGDSWLDLDPTNGRSGSTDMIALAWGRDYDDVSPMRGVILGGTQQHLSVEVDVE